jgi:RNA polymerase sigma factor (sigma-70 family)
MVIVRNIDIPFAKSRLPAGTDDGQLIARFVARRDPETLSAIIERFGGTVWSVCNRVLIRKEDAEDAFQAVFLVLVRSGGRIRNPGALGSWLYGVAYRTAMKARRGAARRKKHETAAPASTTRESPVGAAICRELHTVLDEEVQRLPDKLRDPFVLCCIEGAGKTEAARGLGLPEGTVSSRLARARRLLQTRLTRRGVTLSAVLTALAVAPGTAAAAPPLLVKGTAAALSASLTTKAVAGLSPAAVHLANGVARSLAIAKMKAAGAVMLAVSLAAGGVAVVTNQLAQAPPIKAQRQLLAPLVTFAGPPAPFLETVDEQVLAIAWSPDGERLVTSGGRHQLPGQVKIWDATAHKEIAKARGVRGTRSVAISPDGQTIACGQFGGAVVMRDGLTGVERGALRGHTVGVNSVAYSPDGTALLTAGLDAVVKLWDVKTGTERRAFRGPERGYLSVAWFHDGKRFVTGGNINSASVWDRDRAEATLRLEGHRSVVEGVAVSPDDTIVATASWDNSIGLWHANTGAAITRLAGHQAAVYSVAFSPDGSMLASGSADGEVRLWDTKTYQSVPLPGRHSAAVWSVAFSPNGKVLASGGSDAAAKLWDVKTRKDVVTLSASELRPVTAAAYSPDGKRIVIITDDVARIYDAETGKLTTTLSGHAGKLTCAAFSADGQFVATGGIDKSVRLWNAATGVAKSVLEKHSGPVTAVAFSPNGRRLASGGEDKTVVVWDIDAGAPVRVCTGTDGPIHAVAFGPDGSYVASGGADKTVRLWDPERAVEPVVLEGHDGPVRALTFVGPALVSAGDGGTILIWDPAEGRSAPSATTTPRRLTSAGRITAMATLQGRGGLINSDDGAILQWNLETGRPGGLLMGHSLPITSLAIRPDGKELLSAGLDGRVLRWRPQVQRPVVANTAPAPQQRPAPKPLEPITELYQDFRGSKMPLPPLAKFGVRADEATRPDDRGLHIAVEANAEQTQRIGIRLDRPVQGDFEITAGYEIVRADQPENGHGVGVCLIADLASAQGEVLELMRAGRVNEGQVYGCCRKTVESGKENFFHRWHPTASRAGHLRITRMGGELTYSVREGGADTFKELLKIPCGTEDVKQVLLAANMGFAPNSIDVFLKDLRIGRPGDATTRVVPEASEPRAEAPTAPTRGRFHIILVGLLGLALLLATIGFVLYYGRRRKVVEDVAAADAPPAAAVVVCTGCGKRLLVRSPQSGKMIKCPGCGGRLTIPRSEGTDAAGG